MKNQWIGRDHMKEKIERAAKAIVQAQISRMYNLMFCEHLVKETAEEEIARIIEREIVLAPCPDCGSPQRDMTTPKTWYASTPNYPHDDMLALQQCANGLT